MTHLKLTRIAAVLAAAALGAAGAALAEPQAGAQNPHGNLQGPPGPFADSDLMKRFYQTLLETHKQGDKADLDAMEAKIRIMAEEMRAQIGSTKIGQKEFEDHVMGIAHQALALGVSNPKMFDSYESFKAAMMGPQ